MNGNLIRVHSMMEMLKDSFDSQRQSAKTMLNETKERDSKMFYAGKDTGLEQMEFYINGLKAAIDTMLIDAGMDHLITFTQDDLQEVESA